MNLNTFRVNFKTVIVFKKLRFMFHIACFLSSMSELIYKFTIKMHRDMQR